MATPDQTSSGKCTLPITNEKIDGDVTTVGSITFARSGFLGTGALSTVFRGQCDMRQEVAIKRIHYRTDEERLLIENEVGNLLKVEEDDVKVIRYFMTQRTANFYYIAMELALGTVEDYVERKQGVHTKPDMDELDKLDEISILRDSSKALEWLHQQRIVHRDIKPPNLMLVKSKKGEIVTKLADFGISKEMTASKLKMTAGVGTLDWMAPEARTGESQQGTEKTADIFSLGCVFHFIIFPGQHPFGDMSDRMANIQQGKPCLANIEDPKSVNVATRHLIEEMIQQDPTERPSSTYVVNHPAFWTPKHTKDFFQAVSDCIEEDEEHGKVLKMAVNKKFDHAFVKEVVRVEEWKNVVDATLDEKKAFKSYKETTAGLLRLIRNKINHFNNISKEGREKLGKRPTKIVNYIIGKFPTLLLNVWLAAASIGITLDSLSPFYTETRPPKKLVPREQEGVETQVSLQKGQLRYLQGQLNQALTKLKELQATHSSTESKLRMTEALNEALKQRNASLKKRLHELERTPSATSDVAAAVKTYTFRPGLNEEQLETALRGLDYLAWEELVVTAPPNSSGRWLRLLPPSLRTLYVLGPGKTGKPVPLNRRPDHGLTVVIKRAGDDVIDQLAKELEPPVTALHMFTCPRVTGGALQRLLSALNVLEDITLGGCSGAITDASLAALHGCSQLRVMQLGKPGVLCTDIPVTAVSRLVVTCQKLVWLAVNATPVTCQTVLDALVQADLGKGDDGTARTLDFVVPAQVYEKLRKPRTTSSIEVYKLAA